MNTNQDLSSPEALGAFFPPINPTLAESMRRHHFKRYFQYLRIEACCRKNLVPDLADLAKEKADYHHRLALSLQKNLR